jgi:quinol---cytochrome c reductase iron-sulfur subunit, bacillus type
MMLHRVLRPAVYLGESCIELGRAAGSIAGFLVARLRRAGTAVGEAESEAEARAEEAPPSGPPEAERAMGSGATPKVRSRREVLTLVSVGLGGLAGTIVAIPVIGALVAPLLRSQAPEWRTVGNVSDFEEGKTVAVTFEDPSPLSWAGVASQTGAWLRRASGEHFTAFSVNCTHLGCPVRWLPDANLFMCPCHGGVFYASGAVAGGPPQRPLFVYNVRVREGKVEILSGPVRVV